MRRLISVMTNEAAIDHRAWADYLIRIHEDAAEAVIARHIALNADDYDATVHWCLIREAYLKRVAAHADAGARPQAAQ